MRRKVRAASIFPVSRQPRVYILGGSQSREQERLWTLCVRCFRPAMKRALGGGRPPLRFPALSGAVPRRALGAGSACGVGGSSPVAGASVSLAPAQVKGPRYDPARYVGLTGADIIHEQLKEHGVRVVFGYPGGAILPLFGALRGGLRAIHVPPTSHLPVLPLIDAIHESPHFKFILPRREDGGGHMAEGFSRATGETGVVIVTSGPGATNIVTPLADALLDGTPLVAFTGQVATTHIGTDAFQVRGLSRVRVAWEELCALLLRAFCTAGSPPPLRPLSRTAGGRRRGHHAAVHQVEHARARRA